MFFIFRYFPTPPPFAGLPRGLTNHSKIHLLKFSPCPDRVSCLIFSLKAYVSKLSIVVKKTVVFFTWDQNQRFTGLFLFWPRFALKTSIIISIFITGSTISTIVGRSRSRNNGQHWPRGSTFTHSLCWNPMTLARVLRCVRRMMHGVTATSRKYSRGQRCNPENELEQHLKAFNISGAGSNSFPPPAQEGEEDRYITLHYRLKDEQHSMKIHPSQEHFYRDLIRQLSNSWFI